MLFKNANAVFCDGIKKCDVLTDGERITEIGENISGYGTSVNCEGMYLLPGLIDLHVHGGGGFSAMGSVGDILEVSKAHLKYGVTSLLPTTLAAELQTLLGCADSVREAMKLDSGILGIHLEGPFLSKDMCGAQNSELLLTPSKTDYKAFFEGCRDVVRIAGVAPELDGALRLGEFLKENGIVASVAHSSGDAEVFREAVKHGFSDVTHIFNACTTVHRQGAFKKAGTAEAALADESVSVQVIADLVHLPRELLSVIYKTKGDGKMYLISDGLEFSACEIEEGTVVTQRNGVRAVYLSKAMLLEDKSALAGGASSGIELVRNMHFSVGVPLFGAVRMMSLTPAEVLGITDRGCIEVGRRADLLLTDSQLNIKKIIKGGIEISA